MNIELLKVTLRIASVEEVVRMSPGELSDWNILSIRGRLDELPLNLPGARSVKTLHFDDVEADYPEDHLFAARPEDIEAALAFARDVAEQPLLIHCYAGISRSTALAWIILCDKLREQPGFVRKAFEILRALRPVMLPNRHVIRLGIEALSAGEARKAMMGEFKGCLAELKNPEPLVPYPAKQPQHA